MTSDFFNFLSGASILKNRLNYFIKHLIDFVSGEGLISVSPLKLFYSENRCLISHPPKLLEAVPKQMKHSFGLLKRKESKEFTLEEGAISLGL